MKAHFLLDPNITYLNHGSFGACPKPIFEDYQKWQRELELEPVQFIVYNSWEYLKRSKLALGQYIHAAPEDFYFTPNPTYAVNTIMRSLKLQPGDEILATNHEYGAMNKTWHFFEKQTCVTYVEAPIELPVLSKESLLEQFWSKLSERTKVVFINQISSASGLIFPVAEICAKAKSLDLITIVDGAHVPGHIPLDLAALDPDFYTGTLHKWMLTPKGASFLYVKKAFQSQLDPLVVSWGYEDSGVENAFLAYHEQQGTRDISAFLTAPAAISFLEQNDWWKVSARCKALILEQYPRFCALLGTSPICPVTSEFLGQMCSIPVRTPNPVALKKVLFETYRIEIPVMPLHDQVFIRISLNGYNDANDLEVLYAALSEIKAQGQWIL